MYNQMLKMVRESGVELALGARGVAYRNVKSNMRPRLDGQINQTLNQTQKKKKKYCTTYGSTIMGYPLYVVCYARLSFDVQISASSVGAIVEPPQ